MATERLPAHAPRMLIQTAPHGMVFIHAALLANAIKQVYRYYVKACSQLFRDKQP